MNNFKFYFLGFGSFVLDALLLFLFSLVVSSFLFRLSIPVLLVLIIMGLIGFFVGDVICKIGFFKRFYTYILNDKKEVL